LDEILAREDECDFQHNSDKRIESQSLDDALHLSVYIRRMLIVNPYGCFYHIEGFPLVPKRMSCEFCTVVDVEIEQVQFESNPEFPKAWLRSQLTVTLALYLKIHL
jgi:hypothetical protein